MEKKITLDGKILRLNKKAMDLLHKDEFEKALKLLKDCEKLLTDSKHPTTSELWGITYNNFGCIYKKLNNTKSALFYLSKALEMEIRSNYDATNLASTHLNISAILSSINSHEGSLIHALAALKTLQTFQSSSNNYSVSSVIAYHSIGVENEHLKRYNEALAAYKKGWEVAEKELGTDHKLTETLKRSFVRGCNAPTALKAKKRFAKKRVSHNGANFLPLISTKNSQKTSFTEPKSTPLNRSSETSSKRKTYYMHTRRSLSPISGNNGLKLVSEIESINKLINELDGEGEEKVPKLRIRAENKELGLDTQKAAVLNSTVRNFDVKKREKNEKWVEERKGENEEIFGKKGKGIEFAEENKRIRVENKAKKSEYWEVVAQVVRIQRWWRVVRERMSEKRKAKKFRVKKILGAEGNLRKGLVGGRILRPIPETRFERKIDGVVKIQSWVRMWIQMRKFRKIVESATTIQKHFRRYATKKLYKLILSAITFIQSFYRGHLVRKSL